MEYPNIFLYPSVVAHLDYNDRYKLKNSTAIIFLPKDIKSVFMMAMAENRLNEHLMLGEMLKYVLLESNCDILERFDRIAKVTICKHLNSKIVEYIKENKPEVELDLISV